MNRITNLLALAGMISMGLFGCGGGGGGGGADGSGSAGNGGTPEATLRVEATPPAVAVEVKGRALVARLTIDRGSPIDVPIDPATGELAYEVNLKPGPHTVELVYWVVMGPELVESASVTASITLAAEGGWLAFVPTQFRMADSDGDGFTNVAELKRGTAFDDGSSRPPPEGVISSVNYTIRNAPEGGVGPETGLVQARSADYTFR